VAEVVVVGAGIVGALTALELCERGREVLVLEANEPAGGASGGPGKRGVRANGRDPRELSLARRAHALWAFMAERLDTDIGYERCGHLLLSEVGGAELEVLAERQRRVGIPTEVLDRSGVRDLEPDLSELVVAGAWCSMDAVADHTATTMAALSVANRLGARLRTGSVVADVNATGKTIRLTLQDGEHLEADTCVLAANEAVGPLVKGSGLDLPIFSVLPQALTVRPRRQSPVRHLIGHAERSLNLKTLPCGDVMVTGGRLGRIDLDTGRGVVVESEVLANLADAAAVYPALGDASLLSSSADRADSVSADMVPIIDAVPGGGACLFATGWSGHGWAIAPAVAEMLAIWATTGVIPAHLAPFSADRFAEPSWDTT
jgi:sarcosine oxidase, subunit beta